MRLFRSWVPLLLSAVSFLTDSVDARSRAPDPITYVSELENPVIHTPSHRVTSVSHFDVTFTLHKNAQRLKLALEPNPDILAHDAHVQHLDADGNVKHTEYIDRLAHRVFKGSTWIEESPGIWSRVGWARIYVKKDGPKPLFEGAFSVNHNQHHVKLRSSYMKTKRASDVDLEDKDGDYMVVYRDSDMVPRDLSELKRSLSSSPSCHADELSFNSDPNHPIFRGPPEQSYAYWGAMSVNQLFGLARRQSDISGTGGNAGGVNLQSNIGNTAGCPKTKKVALIGVATDCSFTAAYNSTEDARSNIITMVNTASDLYERTFNISIGLRNLTVSDKNCPSPAPESAPWNMDCNSGNMTTRLDLFSAWRGARDDSNAYWTLMTGCQSDDEVGVSWLGQLCVTGSGNNTVSGANVVARTPTEWQVFAHESGHTFGAVHDCDSQTCAQGLETTSQCCPLSSTTCDADAKYIMNPVTGQQQTQFSQCTVGNICSALGRNSVNSSCLVDNRGVVTITGSQCGNGIVESGEECDCGGEEGCGNNPCCDAQTCKFKNGAVCDDSNENCCINCQFAPSSTVCRPSTGPCDVEEKCTGTSGVCPADQFVPDGQSCGNSSAGLTCASGQCTSRDLQCRQVMGSVLDTNDTYACDSSSCTLLCASSELPMNTCGSLNQNFLDGTPCIGGGHCVNGQCVGSSVSGEIKSWVDNHKPLVIGLAAGLGGLLVLMLLSGIISSIRRRRFAKPVPVRRGGYTGLQQQQGYYWPSNSGYAPPAYPPPPYEQSMGNNRGRMPSMRYA